MERWQVIFRRDEPIINVWPACGLGDRLVACATVEMTIVARAQFTTIQVCADKHPTCPHCLRSPLFRCHHTHVPAVTLFVQQMLKACQRRFILYRRRSFPRGGRKTRRSRATSGDACLHCKIADKMKLGSDIASKLEASPWGPLTSMYYQSYR